MIAEHMAVRQHAGLLTFPTWGGVDRGPQAEQALNYILSNQFTGMPVGKARYSLMLNEAGGVVDDLIVYRRSETSFFLVLNAANTEKDLAWLRSHLQGEASLTDLSDRVAQIAVQGPEADKVLSGLADLEALPKKYYSFVEHVTVASVPCMVSRTGYTGEDGYELYMEPKDAPAVWEALVQAGPPLRLGRARHAAARGLHAALWARIERPHGPALCGLGVAVKLDKEDFIGKSADAAGRARPRACGPQSDGARDSPGRSAHLDRRKRSGRHHVRHPLPLSRGELRHGLYRHRLFRPRHRRGSGGPRAPCCSGNRPIALLQTHKV